MKATEVRRLARAGALNEAWIGYTNALGERLVFARTAEYDDDLGLLVVTKSDSDVCRIHPAEIDSVRH